MTDSESELASRATERYRAANCRRDPASNNAARREPVEHPETGPERFAAAAVRSRLSFL